MKTALGIIVVVLVLIGGGYALVKHNDKKTPASSTSSNSTSNSSNSTMSSNQNSGSTSQTNAVSITNFAFNPSNITVKKGTTVTWTNKDSVAHTVTENDGQDGPKSNDLNQNQTYSFTYNTVGTFKYHCSIHPDMIGSVTVTD
jgi:plastocyanin